MLEFGCKVNRWDGQRVRAALAAAGFAEADDGRPVALAVVNACAVTDRAVRRGRQALRRLRREHPDARLLVTGCMTPVDRARYHAVAADVATLPHAELDRLASFAAEWSAAPPPLADTAVFAPVSPMSPVSPPADAAFEERTRVFLKVVDGCDARCAFCVIPSIRGKIASRPRAEILSEARAFLARGFRELVPCGVHLGHYGRDSGDRLIDLLRALVALDGDFRVRLSSLEPTEIDGALGDLLAGEPRLAPHLHVPLQSGDDATLRRMRRPYASHGYLDRVRLVRDRCPDLALTTDVIVGFPGEDDAAFERTLAVVDAAGFVAVHAFPFSPREGTEAAALDRRVDPRTIRRRVARLLKQVAARRRRWFESRIGTRARVLVEVEGDRVSIGRSEHGVRVRLPGGVPNSTFVASRIAGHAADDLIGEPSPP